MVIYSLKMSGIWDKKKEGISEKKSVKGRENDRKKANPGLGVELAFVY